MENINGDVYLKRIREVNDYKKIFQIYGFAIAGCFFSSTKEILQYYRKEEVPDLKKWVVRNVTPVMNKYRKRKK